MAEPGTSNHIGPLAGLSSKVLLLTVVFVMLGEVLIFLPSIANFRIQWLKTRIAQSEIAALAVDAAPGQIVDSELRSTILKGAGVEAVSVMRNNQRQLVLRGNAEGMVDETFDLRPGMYWNTIGDAFKVMLASKDRLIAVIDKPPAMTGEAIEIALHELPLRDAMYGYALRILGLSVALSLIVAGLIFAALNRLLVRPMRKLSVGMMRFREMPEDPNRVIAPSIRRDEIGIAERELQSMQKQLQSMLQQKSHLAALGLAVAKVSHDLRNMLTSAQLISDRLGGLKDPTVQRFAPKLISSLDRAIGFLNQTLVYGRAQEMPPRRENLKLHDVVDEVIDLMTPWAGELTRLHNGVAGPVMVDADREQLVRILNNLVRNALQAIDTRKLARNDVHIKAIRTAAATEIMVCDNGPGIPPNIREHLFEAFQTSARQGGTGLGLAIAAELVKSHGGEISVVETSPEGTVLKVVIPDRRA
jgi:signal transduction histidine kinase